MNTSDSPGSESTTQKKKPADSLMMLYISIVLITFVAIIALPFMNDGLELETQEKILDAAWIIMAFSQLLIPFTVKNKKRRILALFLCIVSVILMLVVRFGFFNF